ncbi:HMCN [Mytilus edulis]|uniref:HMCN n=1 Tax=Mytilus edulis TaxID=6550 RepID=A0A8S3R1K6_MYTED|nr:HMCN [Mytilus edulis]
MRLPGVRSTFYVVIRDSDVMRTDWSTWEPVGTCSTTCNDGQLEFQRWCNTTIQRPIFTNCVGSNVKYEVCNQGRCPVYKWGHLKELNLTKGDLKEIMKEELDELKRNLTINFKNISATIRKRICARDDRPSAASVGYVGIVLLLIPIVIIISVDAPKLFAVVTHICRKVCKRKVVKKKKFREKTISQMLSFYHFDDKRIVKRVSWKS